MKVFEHFSVELTFQHVNDGLRGGFMAVQTANKKKSHMDLMSIFPLRTEAAKLD